MGKAMKGLKKVALIGLGAMGVLYSDLLQQAIPDDFFVIADKNRIKRYEREGIYCNNVRCTFSYRSKENAVPVDLLIVGVKFGGLQEAIAEAAPFVQKGTVIISLLNGISSEKVLQEAFPEAHVLYCIAQGMDAVKVGNQASYLHKGVLVLGESDGQQSEALQAIGQLFDRVEVPYVYSDAIMRKLWSKLMLNTGINQVVMVYEGTYATVQHAGEAREMMVNTMREVMQVANAEGINLNEEDVQGWLTIADGLNPEGMPSMRQDGMAKRYSEVELFSGTVIPLAQKHGIDVPNCRELYQRIKEMEAAY